MLLGQTEFDTNYVTLISLSNNRDKVPVLNNNGEVDLSQQEIFTIDSLVNLCIEENNNNGKTSNSVGEYIGVHTFKKQFVPSLNENKEIIVWVNCFNSDRITEGLDWKSDLIIVKDGGVGGKLFNLIVNLTTESYSKLYVNGM